MRAVHAVVATGPATATSGSKVRAHHNSSTAAATSVRTIATTDVESDRTVNLADAITSPPVGLLTVTTTGKITRGPCGDVDIDGLDVLSERDFLRVGPVKERELVARQVEDDGDRVGNLADEGDGDRGGLRGETDGVDRRSTRRRRLSMRTT